MNQLRWLQFGGVVMGVTAVLLISLITSGMFDPKPVGELAQTWPPLTLTIPAQEEQITWLPELLPASNFSLHTTLTYQSGEPDGGAGIVLATDCANIIIVLSPLGYATIQQQPLPAVHCPLLTDFPWQPWPHVRTGTQANQIWANIEDGQMQVRINRELLWAGEMTFKPERIGIYGESWGTDAASATAVYHFSQIQLFQSN
jgi:hypothetical protein